MVPPQKNVGAGKTLPYKVSLLLAHRPQVDPQLLALLVKVAALQAERPGRVGHVELMRLEFAQDLVALEGLDALAQGPRHWCEGRCAGLAPGQDCEDRPLRDLVVIGDEEQSLDHVSQLPHV